jgi:hypothetical protein
MKGVGIDKGGRGITYFVNVIDYFWIPIVTKSEGSGIGFKDGGSGIWSVQDVGGGGLGVGGGTQSAYGGGRMEEEGGMIWDSLNDSSFRNMRKYNVGRTNIGAYNFHCHHTHNT